MTSNQQLIYWHHNETLFHPSNSGKAVLMCGPYDSALEKKPIGIWFTWRYFIQNGEELYLDCICQDYYALHKIPDLQLSDLRLLLFNSYGMFLRLFLNKIRESNLLLDLPYYELDSVDLSSIYTEVITGEPCPASHMAEA